MTSAADRHLAVRADRQRRAQRPAQRGQHRHLDRLCHTRNINPLASDSDPNGDPITLQSVGTPGHGTVERTDGGLRYVPADGFSGSDDFGYTVCDNRTPAACSNGTIEVDVAAPVTPPPSGGSDSYAPAPQMVNPTVIQLHVGDDTLRLDDSKDYILQMPDQKKTGGLVIRGGRNVEVIGGYMSIATPGTGGAGAANITISDGPNAVDGHVVRIEGVAIDASSGVEADGIRIAAPKAVVQVVNDRITGLLGSLATTHADLIQPWGGVKELDVDGFTGSSHYNTFYLRRENDPLMPPAAKVVIHDVNVFGLSNPGIESLRDDLGDQHRHPASDVTGRHGLAGQLRGADHGRAQQLLRPVGGEAPGLFHLPA